MREGTEQWCFEIYEKINYEMECLKVPKAVEAQVTLGQNMSIETLYLCKSNFHGFLAAKEIFIMCVTITVFPPPPHINTFLVFLSHLYSLCIRLWVCVCSVAELGLTF